MGFSQKLSALKERAEHQLDVLNSTQKTKNALLLPFFEALGYDPFDVREVEPEYPLDSEGDGSQPVDFAVRVNGTPAMLFECVEATANLDAKGENSVFQRAGELPASLAVLTNGVTYRFFADLGGGEGVDNRPFVEFNLLEQESGQITYLQRLTKSAFDAREVLSAAFGLKYTRRLKSYLAEQRGDPDEHFVRFLAAQVYDGEVSEGVLGHFHPVVNQLLQQLEMENHEMSPQAAGMRSEQGAPSYSKATGPSEDSSTSEPRGQTESSTESGKTNQTEDTGRPDVPNSSETQTADLDAHLQRTPADQSDNGTQESALDNSQAASNETAGSDPKAERPESSSSDSEKGEHRVEEDNQQNGEAPPQTGDSENGELKDEQQKTKDHQGKEPEAEEVDDEAPDRGGGIAEEFASKVIGDS